MTDSLQTTLNPASSSSPPAPRLGLGANLSTGFLDSLRGLAALYVLLHHASYLLHRGYLDQMARYHRVSYAAGYPVLSKLLIYSLAVFRYGHGAVLFFFVLSGFVIHLRYSQKLVEGGPNAKFDLKKYALRRFKRLYPPLVAAIVLTSVLDGIGIHLAFPIYAQNSPYANLNLGCDHRLVTLIGNLVFVMAIYVPAWGSDSPLWSLAYEWWFYTIYPLFWRFTKRSILGATLCVWALLALEFLPHSSGPLRLPVMILSLFPTWWCGVLLADIYTGRLRLPFGFGTLVPLLFCLPLFLMPGIRDNERDLILGLGFTGLIALCFHLQAMGITTLAFLHPLRFLGDMSYTLYVIHMPLLTFLSGAMLKYATGGELPEHPGFLLVGIVLALSIAWVLHLFVEKPFMRRRGADPKVPSSPVAG